MFILDSDIVIWLLRNDKIVVQAIGKTTDGQKASISALTVTEIYKNIFPSETSTTEALFNSLEIIDVNREIAREAGYYWQEHIKQFRTLSLADCIIAATTKVHGSTLLTLNTRHFPMTDIKVINPLK